MGTDLRAKCWAPLHPRWWSPPGRMFGLPALHGIRKCTKPTQRGTGRWKRHPVTSAYSFAGPRSESAAHQLVDRKKPRRPSSPASRGWWHGGRRCNQSETWTVSADARQVRSAEGAARERYARNPAWMGERHHRTGARMRPRYPREIIRSMDFLICASCALRLQGIVRAFPGGGLNADRRLVAFHFPVQAIGMD